MRTTSQNAQQNQQNESITIQYDIFRLKYPSVSFAIISAVTQQQRSKTRQKIFAPLN